MAEFHQGTLVVTRPPHFPTPWTRETVECLVAFGLSDEEIAMAVHATLSELREHYADELASGLARVNSRVMHALLNKALNEGDVAAIKLWLLNKAGWKAGDGPRGLLNKDGSGETADGETVTVVQRRDIISRVITVATREVRQRAKIIDGTVVAAPTGTQKPNGSNGTAHGANGANGARKNGNGNGSGHK